MMFGAIAPIWRPFSQPARLARWQLEEIALASKRDWEKDRMRGFNLCYQ
jgi:hypothetical protein